jgi:hypothetical protein
MSRISVLIGSVPPQGDAPIDEIIFQPDHEWIRAVEHRPKIQNGLAGGEVAENTFRNRAPGANPKMAD